MMFFKKKVHVDDAPLIHDIKDRAEKMSRLTDAIFSVGLKTAMNNDTMRNALEEIAGLTGTYESMHKKTMEIVNRTLESIK